MKPIIFSTPMVQAILAGKKTQTRRVIKFPEGMTGRMPSHGAERQHIYYPGGIKYAPYQPGDILWVRETWNGISFENGTTTPYKTEYWYKADDDDNPDDKWRPSIHMPKVAARIFLRVTNVRAERLQEITEEDAVAEGFEPVPCDHFGMTVWGCTDCGNTGVSEPALLEFVETWDSLNAKRDYGWDKNPWVWVIEFERDESQ